MGTIRPLGIGKSSQATAEELERVDVTLPSAFARSLKAANVHHVALLTAVGADITAKPSAITKTAAGGGLYNHLKGKVFFLVSLIADLYLFFR